MVSRYLLLAAFCALAQPCLAAEPIQVIKAPEEAATQDDAFSDRVDFAWGIALTSNYVTSSGVTQSDDKPALQAYAEISSGIVYTGVWFSTVRLDPDTAEFDLNWGLRNDFGPLSVDVNYTRYFYDHTGNCCGEWIAKASYKLADPLSVSGKFVYDPQTRDRLASFGASLDLSDSLSLSGEIKEKLHNHDTSWNAGLTWQATDTISLDVRYYDSERYDERYVVTLAYDFSTAQ